jgi:transposase
MTPKTTHDKQYNENQAVLYLALELGATKWELGFSTGLGQKPRRRTIEAANTELFQKEVAAAKKRFKLSPDTRVKSCYEAGRDGFWLHRYLTSVGIENIIVDSSSIEIKRRKRRAKTDRLDLAKLLLMLIRYNYGERKVWNIVRPPSPEEEDRRQIHREMKSLKREKTRTTNRIRGLLATQGIRMLRRLDLERERLEAIRLWNGARLAENLKRRLDREWEHVLFLNEQIKALTATRRKQHKEEKEPDIGKIKQLGGLCGIGQESSWIMVRELFGWRKFRNRRELASLTGLTPTPYDSGGSVREQGISKAGNRHVRAIAIEMAWAWLRYQPESELTIWYNQRFAEAGKRARKVGIVALARKLIIALWRYLEWGLLPEGARLKAQELRIR